MDVVEVTLQLHCGVRMVLHCGVRVVLHSVRGAAHAVLDLPKDEAVRNHQCFGSG